MTDVVVERLTIRCRGAVGGSSAHIERTRRRWTRVAAEALSEALEGALDGLDGGATTVVLDRLHLALDLDPFEHDDEVVAALWAERIRAELLPRLVEVAAAVDSAADELPERDDGRPSPGDTIAASLPAGGPDQIPDHVASATSEDRQVSPSPTANTPAPEQGTAAPRPEVVASDLGVGGRSPGTTVAPARRGSDAEVADSPTDSTNRDTVISPTASRADLAADVGSSAPADLPPDRRPDSSAASPSWATIAATDQVTPTALGRDAVFAPVANTGNRHIVGTSSRVAGLVLLYPWLGAYLRSIDDRRLALALLMSDEPAAWLDDPLIAILAGDASANDPDHSPVGGPDPAAPSGRAASEAIEPDPAYVLRRFASYLPGFAESSPDYLRVNFLVRGASLDLLDDSVLRVRLESHPLDPLLRLLPYPTGMFVLPGTPTITVVWPS